jgi:hypothetical protein
MVSGRERCESKRIRRRWQVFRKYLKVQGEVQSGRPRIGVKHHSDRFIPLFILPNHSAPIPVRNVSKSRRLEPFQPILPRIRIISSIQAHP